MRCRSGRGALVEVKDHYVMPDWDDTKRAEICTRVAECLATGGAAWGATAAGGRASRWPQWTAGRSVATPGWWRWTCCTSAPRGAAAAWRAALTGACGRLGAVAVGAHTLYVSATNTTDRSRSTGGSAPSLADPPDPAWFAREPLDVHLRIPLPLADAVR